MTLDEFLVATIHEYDNGGLSNEQFIENAHLIYNAFACFPCPLQSYDYPYLLGIVFSGFAPYYKHDINIYTSIMENALFCFMKIIKEENHNSSEYQCAAIRLLLLIHDNDWVMKGITQKFQDKNCLELYGEIPFVHHVLYQGVSPWAYEIDILTHLGQYCIAQSRSDSKQSSISASDMRKFKEIVKGQDYQVKWPLVHISDEQVFNLFYEFITEYVSTPYERRISHI